MKSTTLKITSKENQRKVVQMKIRRIFSMLLCVCMMMGAILPICVNAEKPTAVTVSAKNVTSSSATLVGKVTKNGGYVITRYGFNYGVDGSGKYTTKSFSGHIDSNVEQTFELTGLKSGTRYFVEFWAINQDGESKGSYVYFTTKTDEVIPTGVSLNKTSATLYTGDTLKLTATVTPSNATDKDVSWKTSNSTVATVSSSGVITAKKAGTATITATTYEGNKSATCTITVKEEETCPPTFSSYPNDVTINLGDTYTFKGTVNKIGGTISVVNVAFAGPDNWTKQARADYRATDINKTSFSLTSWTFKPTQAGEYRVRYDINCSDGNNLNAVYQYITVKDPTPQAIIPTQVSLNRNTATIYVDDTLQLTASISPSNATDKGVTWSSSNSTIAMVDANGFVIARRAGAVVITATTNSGDKTATCTVTIKEDETYPPTFSLYLNDVEINLGDTYTFKGTIDKVGGTISVVNIGIAGPDNWNIAAIDKAFRIENINKASFSLTNQNWTFKPTKAGLYRIRYDINCSDGNNLNEVFQYITVVSQNEEVKGNNPTKQEIVDFMVSDLKTRNRYSDEMLQIVMAVAWTESKWVHFNTNGTVFSNKNTNGTTDWGIMQINEASIGKANADCVPYLKEDWKYNLRWGIGCVINAYDEAKKANEENIIKATYSRYNGGAGALSRYRTKTDSRDVNFWNHYQNKPWGDVNIGSTPETVNPPLKETTAQAIATTGVSLSRNTATIYAYDSLQLTATVTPSNATDKSVTWSSSDTKVATVSSNGLITAKKAGSATITATTNSGNKTSTCKITVIEEETYKPTFSSYPNGVTINLGDTYTFKGTIDKVGGTISVVNIGIAGPDDWNIAAIDKAFRVENINKASFSLTNQNWTFKPTKAGVYRVRYDINCSDGNNLNEVIQYITVEEKAVQTIAPTKVSMNKSLATMFAYETLSLTATIIPGNATDKSVTWKTSNSSVATVNDGVVTALKAGIVKITVTTNDGNKSATCTVTVFPSLTSQKTIVPTKVTLNKNETLYVGDKLSLTATILPVDATDKSVTWKTSDSKVATVSNNGLVTAVKEGTATITVTTNSGKKTATCEITVSPANTKFGEAKARAEEIMQIKWSPLADIKTWNGNTVPYSTGKEAVYKKGQTFFGLPYSMPVSNSGKFIFRGSVTVDTFLNAIADKNNDIYKNTYTTTINGNKRIGPMYGTECSTFVSYIINLTDIKPKSSQIKNTYATTVDFNTYADTDSNKEFYFIKDWNQIKPGDIINYSGSHIRFVIDVIRDKNGNVTQVTTYEQACYFKAVTYGSVSGYTNTYKATYNVSDLKSDYKVIRVSDINGYQ